MREIQRVLNILQVSGATVSWSFKKCQREKVWELVCSFHSRLISTVPSHLYFPAGSTFFSLLRARQFTAGWTHLGFPQEELQVSAAQDAVVLDVAREVHGAGAVHGAVDLHVAVDDVQVFLFVLEETRRHIQLFH